MLLLSSADFFSKLTFSKYSFWNAIRVSNGLDPDQDRHFVGPDLGLNCLQRPNVAACIERVNFDRFNIFWRRCYFNVVRQEVTISSFKMGKSVGRR